MAMINSIVERMPATFATMITLISMPKGTKLSKQKNTAIQKGKRYFKFLELDMIYNLSKLTSYPFIIQHFTSNNNGFST